MAVNESALFSLWRDRAGTGCSLYPSAPPEPASLHPLRCGALEPQHPFLRSLVAGRKPIPTYVGNCFFDLLFIASVIITIFSELPGGPCISARLLTKVPLFGSRRDCPCPPGNRRDSHTPPKGWPFPWQCFARLKTLSLLHCLSLSILPFDFSSLSLLSLWSIKEPGIQTVILRASLPSSRSAGSLIQVSSLPQHLLFWIHRPVRG